MEGRIEKRQTTYGQKFLYFNGEGEQFMRLRPSLVKRVFRDIEFMYEVMRAAPNEKAFKEAICILYPIPEWAESILARWFKEKREKRKK